MESELMLTRREKIPSAGKFLHQAGQGAQHTTNELFQPHIKNINRDTEWLNVDQNGKSVWNTENVEFDPAENAEFCPAVRNGDSKCRIILRKAEY